MTNDGEREFIIDKETADEIATAVPPGELPYAECETAPAT
jgi:hypothetical protein